MIRILLDQGLPRTTVLHLKDQGWDVLHVGDIGLSKAKDLELIEYARENDRVIITLDSDFHAYLAVNNAEDPSVIRIRREGLKVLEMAKLIISIWPKAVQEELNNLVRNNFLYYNPTLAQYKLQGKSMEIGLMRYVQEVGGE